MVEVSLGIREVWCGSPPPLRVQEVCLCLVMFLGRWCGTEPCPHQSELRTGHFGEPVPTQHGPLPTPTERPTALDPMPTQQSNWAAADHEPVFAASGDVCAADDGNGSGAPGLPCLGSSCVRACCHSLPGSFDLREPRIAWAEAVR